MGFIVIPSDFVEGVTPVVPIFVRDEDANRVRIAQGWIDGVVTAADKLRTLARRILLDEWRVSELADEALQVLWQEHGEDVGLSRIVGSTSMPDGKRSIKVWAAFVSVKG